VRVRTVPASCGESSKAKDSWPDPGRGAGEGAAGDEGGTSMAVAHLGHFNFRPAALSGALSLVPQDEQATGMGMMAAPQLAIPGSFFLQKSLPAVGQRTSADDSTEANQTGG